MNALDALGSMDAMDVMDVKYVCLSWILMPWMA